MKSLEKDAQGEKFSLKINKQTTSKNYWRYSISSILLFVSRACVPCILPINVLRLKILAEGNYVVYLQCESQHKIAIPLTMQSDTNNYLLKNVCHYNTREMRKQTGIFIKQNKLSNTKEWTTDTCNNKSKSKDVMRSERSLKPERGCYMTP